MDEEKIEIKKSGTWEQVKTQNDYLSSHYLNTGTTNPLTIDHVDIGSYKIAIDQAWSNQEQWKNYPLTISDVNGSKTKFFEFIDELGESVVSQRSEYQYKFDGLFPGSVIKMDEYLQTPLECSIYLLKIIPIQLGPDCEIIAIDIYSGQAWYKTNLDETIKFEVIKRAESDAGSW